MIVLITFVTAVTAGISTIYLSTFTSEEKRQNYAWIVFVAFIIVSIIGISILETRVEERFFIYTISLAALASGLFGQYINYLKNKKTIIYQLAQELNFFAFISSVLCLLLSMQLILSEDQGLLPSDFEYSIVYFVNRYGVALQGLIIGITVFINSFQSVKFNDNGLMVRGTLWQWTDFQFYLLEKSAKTTSFDKIKIAVHPNFRFPLRTINLKIATKDTKDFDTWLSQKLPRKQDTSTEISTSATSANE